MALEQTNIIDPYVPWTGWGDYAFNDDVNAITEYIENQRPKIREFPQLQSMIEQYESWLTNLSWFEKYMTPDATKGKAVYYRDQVNDIIKTKLDPADIPGDIGTKIVPVDPSTAPDAWSTFMNQFIPESLSSGIKKIAIGVVIVATGGAVIYLFGPAIRSIVSAKAEQRFGKKESTI